MSSSHFANPNHFIWGAGALGQALALKIRASNPNAQLQIISRRDHSHAWPPTPTALPAVHWVTYKAYDLDSFLDTLSDSGWTEASDSLWIFMQNGIGIVERLKAFSELHPGFQAARGSAYFGGYFDGDKNFVPTGGDKLEVCAVSNFKEARELEWKKAFVNCSMNAVAAIADVRNGEVAAQPKLWSQCLAALQESVQIAQAQGIVIARPLEQIQATVTASSQNFNSMCQDLRSGRPTEIQFLNGALMKLGLKHGILTPIHESLTQQILSLENRSRPR